MNKVEFLSRLDVAAKIGSMVSALVTILTIFILMWLKQSYTDPIVARDFYIMVGVWSATWLSTCLLTLGYYTIFNKSAEKDLIALKRKH